ncbi:hypothetical protein M9H77_22670 [Catharanthus roseus]|uniref:Uncharacterized protein n=1 Tax=Catharanthus roseus TaxID=4058 RepID=A0ACC0ATN0_CATRO|nr:hypothetical protein M9H77_22670 [Catharanthus roseus]
MVTSIETTSSNLNVPVPASITNVVSSIVVHVSITLLHINPIFLLKSHGHVLQNFGVVGSSSQQQVVLTESPARPVVSTNVEYSGIVNELVVLKTLKGKNKKRVRESTRIRELSESSKRTRIIKSGFRLVSAEKALNDIFYDNFHAKKYNLVKTRGITVENYFAEESLSKISSIDLLDSISNFESSFNGIVYVRKEVVDFNVEELLLKEEMDLDIVTRELTEGYKRNLARRREARPKPLQNHSSPSNFCMCPHLLLSINMLIGFSFRSFNSRLPLF